LSSLKADALDPQSIVQLLPIELQPLRSRDFNFGMLSKSISKQFDVNDLDFGRANDVNRSSCPQKAMCCQSALGMFGSTVKFKDLSGELRKPACNNAPAVRGVRHSTQA
jgi:hypothetical protein